MKPIFIYREPRPVSMGELCEAVADGSIPAGKEGAYYNVRKPDVLRLAEALLAREVRREVEFGTADCELRSRCC